MELINEDFRVAVRTETAPLPHNFNIVHNPENVSIDDAYMARVLDITKHNGDHMTVALLDTLCPGYEPCAVLEGHSITVILFKSILRVDLDTGLIPQFARCDHIGGLFEIHSIEGGYIIWGEEAILRYDLNLKQIWQFTGEDILVSLSNDKHFRIADNIIHFCDFEGWHYMLDFNGTLIGRFREHCRSDR